MKKQLSDWDRYLLKQARLSQKLEPDTKQLNLKSNKKIQQFLTTQIDQKEYF
jgi:hypothetical protein